MPLLWILHHIQVFCCLQEQSPILGWAPQPNAPKCLVSHLAFIQFKGFLGLPDEVSFVEHVLQEGIVLKTMIISDISLDQSTKYDILKRISNVPRASGMCRLTFDWVVPRNLEEKLIMCILQFIRLKNPISSHSL